MALPVRASNLDLFTAVVETEPTSARRIGKDWVPPEHRATKAIPDSLLSVPREVTAQLSKRATMVAQQLQHRLGRPHTNSAGFLLYNLDCRKLMAAMDEAGIHADLTLTSPPYNIGKEYERALPLDEYLRWCQEWLGDVWNVTRAHGALWLNLGYVPVPERGRAVPLTYLLWDKTHFFLQQEIVWNYGAGVASKRMFSPRNEKWLFFTKEADTYTFNLDLVRDPNVKYPNQKKNGKFRCNPLGKNPSDVWPLAKVTTGRNRSSKERTGHPAQFPLELVERIVKVSTDRLQTVLDPFSGSGSSGIAAIGNGCMFIGAELRADYCDMAGKRVAAFLEMADKNRTFLA